jgi:hypothetical protein
MKKPAGKPFKLEIDSTTVSSFVECVPPECIVVRRVLPVDHAASRWCSSPLATKPKSPDFALVNVAYPGRSRNQEWPSFLGLVN